MQPAILVLGAQGPLRATEDGKCKDRAAERAGRAGGWGEDEKAPQGGKDVSLVLKGVKKG